MKKFIQLLMIMLVAGACYTQVSQSYVPPYSQPVKKTKKAKITLETFDGNNYKGNLITIGYDYLLIDAKAYNSPAKLRPYYIRAERDYSRFDIEYIKTATMTRGRSVASATLSGTMLGVVLAGLLSWAALKDETLFDSFGEWAITSGFVIGLGTTAGFISGLLMRKKIMIEGNPRQLEKLESYYHP